jgi:hypothetical protein
MSDELYEILAKRLENLSNTNTEEAKAEWDKIQKMKEAEQANKSLADIYYDRFREFGDLLSALVTIRFNLHPMSGYFAPFVLYLTPQCGEYKHHQTILDSFAKINSELISERVYDEDEE